jgi:Domain of unknown function (DUF1887).
MLVQIEYFDNDSLTNMISILTTKPDKVIFIYDKEISTLKSVKYLYEACKSHLPNLKYETFTVDSDDLEAVCNLTQKVIPKNNECIIDLTGGGDLLTIGGYKTGKLSNTKMVYADIRKNHIIDVETNEILYQTVNITLKDYLLSKNASCIGTMNELPKQNEISKYKDMCNYIFRHKFEWKKTCAYLQHMLVNTQDCFVSGKKFIEINERTVHPNEDFLQYCQSLGFIHDLKIGNTVEFHYDSLLAKKYLTTYGIWLELFVYLEACQLFGVSDVMMGAKIDWDAKDGYEKVGNEIDVIFVRNSRPVTVSCKFTEPDIAAINEILINTRRIGGNKGKALLIAYCDMKKAETGAFQRAKELGIRVLDREDILSNDFKDRLQHEIDLGDKKN